jgi:hypothetical protein
LFVEAVLLRGVVISLGAVPCERLGLLIVIEMFEFSLAQLAVERQPLRAKCRRQGIEVVVDRSTQPRNIHLVKYGRVLLDGDEFIGKASMLQAIVQVDFTRLEAFSDLPVYPELVAVGMHTCRLPFRIERQQIGAQGFG